MEKGNTLSKLALYFLKLGATGFGGPIALVGYMHRDLVEEKKWVSNEEFDEGVTLSQLAPGPFAAQMAIYIGWLKGRVWGATLIGFAFVLPSFLMILALSATYLKYGGISWIQGVFYGVGAAVIAIITISAYKLVSRTFKSDLLLWTLGVISAFYTAWTESEIVWIFIGSGAIVFILRAWKPRANAIFSLFLPPLLLTGLKGPAAAESLVDLALCFTKAGAFVFGSGLAIVPFLQGGVVNEFQWLTERQFIGAVAVAMITPGPVVITVAFIGYLVAGPLGGLVAALGVFLPCYLLTVIPAPHFHKFARHQGMKAFVDGVTAAAIGAIAGSAFVLGERALVDIPSVVIAAVALLVILKFRKLPEPILILAAGFAGLAIKGM